jgi:predicted ATP-grasp superfamily ATP-dependent carboligase
MGGADGYCEAVARLVAERRARVLLPITEGSTLALLERRELFPTVRIPTAELGTFRRATDKALVLALAHTVGIAAPSQWTVSGAPDDIPDIPPGQYPVVIKPSRSVVGPDGARRKVGVSYAQSPEQLRRKIAALGTDAGPLLIQTRIDGPGMGIFILRWRGEVLATFAHRRIREKPPSGGVSVLCESIAAPPDLIAKSTALLAALDWNGVAMVEYKQDSRTGQPYLMEINPRFWGSLQLAIDAGIDFPRYLVDLALGREINPAHSWDVGMRSRWRWGEVDHLITRLRRSAHELDLPPDTPGVIRTAISVLAPWQPRTRSEVFRWSDPVPSFRETVAWIRAL